MSIREKYFLIVRRPFVLACCSPADLAQKRAWRAVVTVDLLAVASPPPDASVLALPSMAVCNVGVLGALARIA